MTQKSMLPGPPAINFLHEGKRVPPPIANHEVHAIADNSVPHLADAIDLGPAFALREQEILQARRSWIDWQLEGLRLPAAITKSADDHFKKASPAATEMMRRRT